MSVVHNESDNGGNDNSSGEEAEDETVTSVKREDGSSGTPKCPLDALKTKVQSQMCLALNKEENEQTTGTRKDRK